jgi:hypothetical protein
MGKSINLALLVSPEELLRLIQVSKNDESLKELTQAFTDTYLHYQMNKDTVVVPSSQEVDEVITTPLTGTINLPQEDTFPHDEDEDEEDDGGGVGVSRLRPPN